MSISQRSEILEKRGIELFEISDLLSAGQVGSCCDAARVIVGAGVLSQRFQCGGETNWDKEVERKTMTAKMVMMMKKKKKKEQVISYVCWKTWRFSGV